MKKILLFAIAILFTSIAFAAEKPYYCIKFTQPEWNENHLGCQSCPVKDSHGNIIDCNTSGANPKQCCYGKPKDGRCTTDHLCGYLNDPKCKAFFEGHLAYGHVYGSCSNTSARGNNNGGGKGTVKPEKPTKPTPKSTEPKVKNKTTANAKKPVVK